jgi:hypothetical protein
MQIGRLFWHPDDGTPGHAGSPEPADSASDAPRRPTLRWAPGFGADSHIVYFGRTSPSPSDTPLADTTATSLDVGLLLGGTTYFWRVDERNAIGTTTGAVWQFTTGGVRADIDGDGDVDLEDFGLLQACLTGSFTSLDDPSCSVADLNDDERVERNDVTIFLGCLTGPNAPVNSLCD